MRKVLYMMGILNDADVTEKGLLGFAARKAGAR
jgi:hypothetical protein